MRRCVLLMICLGLGNACMDDTTTGLAQAAEAELAALQVRRDELKQSRASLRVKVAESAKALQQAQSGTEPAQNAEQRIAAEQPCNASHACDVEVPPLCAEESVALVRPTWSCDPLSRTSLCSARVELPGSSSWSSAGWPTLQALTRVVRVHEGHVLAADWPPPEPGLYSPVDDEARARCERREAQARCRAQCLKVDVCSLGAAPEAREPCEARCPVTAETPPHGRVEVTSRLHSEPAPGAYVMEVDETFLDGDGKVLGVRTLTRLLADPWIQPGRMPKQDSLTSLSLLAEAEDARTPVTGSKLPSGGYARGAGWMTLAKSGNVLVVPGPQGRGLRGFAFSDVAGEPPIQPIPSGELCRHPKDFPAAWRDAWIILCQTGGG